MLGTQLPLAAPKAAGARTTLPANLALGAILALLVCATLLSGRASAADLALHVAPKTQRETPVPMSNPLKRLFEEFLRWKRALPR